MLIHQLGALANYRYPRGGVLTRVSKFRKASARLPETLPNARGLPIIQRNLAHGQ